MFQPFSRRIAFIVTSALLVSGLAGCALLAKKPLADPAIRGSLADNVYTSPQKSFRIRMPWLSTDATIRAETATPNTVLVTIADDLCREFIVSQHPGFLGGQSLESWVDAHIAADLKRFGFEVQSKPLMTRNGLAISLRYRAPAASPCSRTVEVDGKKVVTKLDADVGWYIYHRDGLFYRLIYVIGIGPEAPRVWYVKREPVDEVLAYFAEGFEVLGTKDK